MPTTDQYGNTWVDDPSAPGGGYWVGAGDNAGQFYYGGAWHLSEPSGGSAPRYWTGTPSDGRPYGTYVTDASGQPVGDPIGNPQAPSTTTHVTVNPADTTGAWSVVFDSTGQGYRVNK